MIQRQRLRGPSNRKRFYLSMDEAKTPDGLRLKAKVPLVAEVVNSSVSTSVKLFETDSRSRRENLEERMLVSVYTQKSAEFLSSSGATSH